jgi:Uma2 family endonuclease
MAEHAARTKLTYDDYLLLPEDGRQHEIIDGEHFMNAAPNPRHQRVSRRIQWQLYRQLEETGRGEVFNASIDLVLSPNDVVQPDLLVILRDNADIVLDTRIVARPDLVVEVLSPSTADRDRRLKRTLYESAGVPEYWVADPLRNVLHQHVLEAGRYGLAGTHEHRVEAATIRDVAVDLDVVWEAGPSAGRGAIADRP